MFFVKKKKKKIYILKITSTKLDETDQREYFSVLTL